MQATPRTLNGMFQKMFQISNIFGVFPFVFTDSDLVFSHTFLLCSILYTIFSVSTTTYFLLFQFNMVSNILKSYATIFSFFIPYILPLLVPISSILWLWTNLKKFNKIFQGLNKVEVVIKRYDLLTYGRHHFLFFIMATPIFIFQFINTESSKIVITLLYFMMMNIQLVMIQFICITATIKNFYSFLEETLTCSNVLKWTRCHEVLGTCCEIVNRCYSPQLLIFTLSSFSYATSTIYLLIAHRSYFSGGDHIASVFWVLYTSLGVWVLVFHCHETVQKAKSFDKELSRLVLNDNTKKLLRNRKILYHFRPKRIVEFSAMGFFKFDYSLLCKMISTATTYIVIMVQFTPGD